MGDGFQFLRPLWLAALPFAALFLVALRRLGDPRAAWRGVIDPHLLDALLVVHRSRRGVGPLAVLGFVWFTALIALAGPTWRREPAPFAEDSAALVAVIKVAPSMRAKDVQPSRLTRAAQKLADLLKLRTDAEVALFAYAGSAHRVMPLTADAELITSFAAALDPEIMPVDGDVAAEALALANAELRRARRSGSIVLLADGASAVQVDAFSGSSSVPVHVLGIGAGSGTGAAGAPPPDFDALRAIADASGGTFTRVRADATDVERVARNAERRIGATSGDDDADARWKDDGYWLVPLVVLGVLCWSRRGWFVAIEGASR